MGAPNPVTCVVFRVWKAKPGGVIALMPRVPADRGGHCVCYEHHGQHGAANYHSVMCRTRPANQKEYGPLLKELRQIGYKVQVVLRRSNRRIKRNGTVPTHSPGVR